MAANRWAFGGVDLVNDLGLRCVSVSGYKALPPSKGGNVATPSVPGEEFVRKVHGPKRISLGLLLSSPAADTWIIDDTLRRLAQVFGKNHILQPLTQYVPEGGSRSALAECVAWDPQDQTKVGTVYLGTADFEIPGTYFYDDRVVTLVESISASPTDFSWVHPGDARSPCRLVLDYLGPIINPKLRNKTNNVSVECDVAVGAGQHLVIDTVAWTAYNDALGTPVNAIRSLKHSGDNQLFVFEPGVQNDLEVTASSPGGSLTLTLQPSFF